MSVQVKICGINSAEAADAAARAGADFAGLVFFSKSPRHVSYEQAEALADRLRGGPRLVALFVNPDDSTIAEAIAAARPDFLQLHGTETAQRTAQIAARFGLPVIKAIPVAESSDLAVVAAYDEVVEHLLFDAKAPHNADRPGGHGAAFDWPLLSSVVTSRPFFLAGGLTAENVVRAVQASGAQMVDTSSGVEIKPGQKSPEKIRDFIQAARNASYPEQA
jgi:phosphoribosylanthranilate isomerase